MGNHAKVQAWHEAVADIDRVRHTDRDHQEVDREGTQGSERMSMLSAQCDELRAMAESVGLAMPQAATLMMEAADTILSLRDRAQELQSENSKLREQGARLFDKTLELGTENAKLRESLDAVLQCAGETKRDKGCDACPMYNGPCCKSWEC